MERPAISRLVASRLTSHSQGPGSVSSKSLMSKTRCRSGRGERPEVRQVGVPAHLHGQPRPRRPRQVAGHRQRGPAEERERRGRHPPVADGQQLPHASRVPGPRAGSAGPLDPARGELRVAGSRHLRPRRLSPRHPLFPGGLGRTLLGLGGPPCVIDSSFARRSPARTAEGRPSGFGPTPMPQPGNPRKPRPGGSARRRGSGRPRIRDRTSTVASGHTSARMPTRMLNAPPTRAIPIRGSPTCRRRRGRRERSRRVSDRPVSTARVHSVAPGQTAAASPPITRITPGRTARRVRNPSPPRLRNTPRRAARDR